MNRRLAKVMVSKSFLAGILRGPGDIKDVEKIESSAPDDLKIIKVLEDVRDLWSGIDVSGEGHFLVIVESETFKELKPGEMIPEIAITFSKIYREDR